MLDEDEEELLDVDDDVLLEVDDDVLLDVDDELLDDEEVAIDVVVVSPCGGGVPVLVVVSAVSPHPAATSSPSTTVITSLRIPLPPSVASRRN